MPIKNTIEGECLYTNGGECWFYGRKGQRANIISQIRKLSEESIVKMNDPERSAAFGASIERLKADLANINQEIELREPCRRECHNKESFNL